MSIEEHTGIITTHIDTGALAKEIARELARELAAHEAHKKTSPQRLPETSSQNGAKQFAILRSRIEELGMDYEYFARKLGIGKTSLSRRMTGKVQWQMEEMYKALDVLSLPYDLLPEYFPKDGGKKKQS